MADSGFGSRAQLGDEAAELLRAKIMSGEVAEGEFLRPEHLAREFGISATPVREGLMALREQGFVTLEPRRGFQVAPLGETDITDLFKVQAFISGLLAQRAAEYATADEVDELADLQSMLMDAIRTQQFDRAEELDFQFHKRLNSLAGRPKLLWFLGLLVRYTPRRLYVDIHTKPSSGAGHDRILDALRAGDASGARIAMETHVHKGGESLVTKGVARPLADTGSGT